MKKRRILAALADYKKKKANGHNPVSNIEGLKGVEAWEDAPTKANQKKKLG